MHLQCFIVKMEYSWYCIGCCCYSRPMVWNIFLYVAAFSSNGFGYARDVDGMR